VAITKAEFTDSSATSGYVTVADRDVVVGFEFPATFEGTSLTFTTGDGDFAVEDDTSTAVSITVAPGSVSMLTTPTKIAAISPLKKFKLVSGTSQTGACTVNVLLQRVC
jgi:hypothetical protein